MKRIRFNNSIVGLIITLALQTNPFITEVGAQDKQLVQLKVFDQQFQLVKDIEVSLNGKPYLTTGQKGVAFVELHANELPVRSVKIENEALEAASWSFSKGTLEIVVRKKRYRMTDVVIQNVEGVAIPDLTVTYNGKKPIAVVTNAEGKAQLPIPTDEAITADRLSITGHNVLSLASGGDRYVVAVEPQLSEAGTTTSSEPPTTSKKEYFSNFDLSKLDSIRSLTVFYAIFKSYPMKNLNEQARRRVDAKFNQLMVQLQDSLNRRSAFIGKISDSSFVSEDIKNLMSQADLENKLLGIQRQDFDAKIALITGKLEEGLANLDPETRQKLLSDLTRLENMLLANENQFYKNQSDFRNIINGLKQKFFDFEGLEEKLSLVEAERLRDQRVFRQRLLAISAVLVVFITLIVLLISFSNELRKQKAQLVQANEEIKSINENLENIVQERTKLLADANKELDTFLYRASHDLRSPVRSIIGLCSLGEYLPQKELVERVGKTTAGMDRLLQKLAMVSEINHPTDLSAIRVYDLVQRVQNKFQPVIRNQNIYVQLNCDPDLTFCSYPHVVEIIITNLLENALFYSTLRDPDDARIELNIQAPDEMLVISVVDNGIGISDEVRPKLFDMFYKGHERSTGNGLGLYIVQKSVHSLNGEIEVGSDNGHNTIFTVRLPLAGEPMMAPVLEEAVV
jgi:signal transduction histidine kinase